MKLLLDLGNTRLKLALAQPGQALHSQALTHAAADFPARLEAWLHLHGAGIAADAVWLATVAPPETNRMVLAACARAGLRPHQVTPRREALGLQLAYAEPMRLGVDRWLALLALQQESAAPCLVAGVGSALTLDALAPGGRHLGGLIAPTPEGMCTALQARLPHLPRRAAGATRIDWLGQDTDACIESGCVLAAAGLIEASLRRLSGHLGEHAALVLSGGGAEPLRPWLPPHRLRPELVLEGLRCWAEAVAAGQVAAG